MLRTHYNNFLKPIVENDHSSYKDLVCACRELLMAEEIFLFRRQEQGLVLEDSTQLDGDEQHCLLPVPQLRRYEENLQIFLDQDVPPVFRVMCPETCVLVVLHIHPFWWLVAQYSSSSQIQAQMEVDSFSILRHLLHFVFHAQAHQALNQEIQDAFLKHLMMEPPRDERLLIEQAVALNYDLFSRQTVVLVEHSDLPPVAKQKNSALDLLQRHLKKQFPEMLCTVADEVVFCLFPSSSELEDRLWEGQKKIAQIIGVRCLFSVSTLDLSFKEVPKGYQQAQDVLNFGKNYPRPRSAVTLYKDHMMYRYVTVFTGQQDSYYEKVVNLVRHPQGGERLVRTLAVYFQHSNVPEKCTQLRIHRDTYYDHLRLIEKILGMDLKYLGDATFPLHQAAQAYLAQLDPSF